MREIENIVCIGEELVPSDIHTRSRMREIKEARQIIMYFAREKTKLSWRQIAGYFNMNHATALNAVQRMKDYIDTDIKFREKINEYNKKITDLVSKQCVINSNIMTLTQLIREADYLKRKVEELMIAVDELNNEIINLNN